MFVAAVIGSRMFTTITIITTITAITTTSAKRTSPSSVSGSRADGRLPLHTTSAASTDWSETLRDCDLHIVEIISVCQHSVQN